MEEKLIWILVGLNLGLAVIFIAFFTKLIN
jgi:hypothetical protein